MPSYFDHNDRNGKRNSVSLDVVEFEPVITEDGFHVIEHTRDDVEFRRLFAELMESLK